METKFRRRAARTWRLRRQRHIGSSCDSLELPAPCHARLRIGAAAFGRTAAAAATGSAAFGRAGALAPSAPAGTLIAMQLSRAGQSNLARLLARKPWTPRAFHAKTM